MSNLVQYITNNILLTFFSLRSPIGMLNCRIGVVYAVDHPGPVWPILPRNMVCLFYLRINEVLTL